MNEKKVHTTHPEDASGDANFANDKASIYAGQVHADSEDLPSLKVEQNEPEDVFGNEDGAEVKYKTMAWWQAGMVMIAENISLGILSLPAVAASIGLVPGIIVLILLGLLATYSGYVYWQFKMKFPFVNNLADAGQVMFGPIGKEIFGAAFIIFCVFCMASHLLTWTIAMNTITGHATCTLVWGVIGVVVFFLLTIPRTLKNVSYLSIASFISIGSAVILTMIALGISPAKGAHIEATLDPSFSNAFLSTTNIVFAYACHVAFLSFISELREPRDFPKSLILLQSIDITLYLIVMVVVYRYAGADVSSPALGSTGHIVRKIAYGIALPTILIAGVIFAHISCKYVYIRMFQGTKYLSSRGLVATGTWLGLGFLFWVIAFIIASSIPNFNDLLGFVSSLFASWFSFGLAGYMWLWMNWGRWTKGWKKWVLCLLNILLVVVGAAICGLGLYASGKSMAENSSGASWSCADNS
ncbi:hypothetical protein K490DRAFT_32850 [Saccharata proteae CBS 121410]|uniref:Amino acid transporter transmembrane domain-containing protein n=1 Tax=Saccharata proteae CBS 121410 TaxID=1314787 RepID=A0A9P4I198_9PEZI|nr:hypothetical protein K490DRAFT_32850 [Saccharata proteae CBS 121410]